jgi:arylsulfatase A-like enzyme
LIVLADDLSVADLPCYPRNPALPRDLTPHVDALVARGLLFENAWTNPLCSPTRASILTGRHAFRTGIGKPVTSASIPLRPSETTLPEAIDAYSAQPYTHGAFGKWHLESQPGLLQPATRVHGFDAFFGTLRQVKGDYCDWEASGEPMGGGRRTQYMPAAVFDAARDWIGAQPGPWFCYLAPQSPYDIHHVPPGELQGLVAGSDCAACPDDARRCYLAAIQAFDTKLGELLDALGPDWIETTTIVLSGDNGTPQNALAVWPDERGKGTLYQGGIHVPLIVAGRAVAPELRGTRTPALANLTDVFRTFVGLAGGEALPDHVAEDSVDLRPLLAGRSADSGRTVNVAERFGANLEAPPYPRHRVAAGDGRFKLIYSVEARRSEELFDLHEDPLEAHNLLAQGEAGRDTPAGRARVELERAIRGLLGR